MAKPLLGLRKDGICVDVHAWVLAEGIIDRLFAVKLVGEVRGDHGGAAAWGRRGDQPDEQQ